MGIGNRYEPTPAKQAHGTLVREVERALGAYAVRAAKERHAEHAPEHKREWDERYMRMLRLLDELGAFLDEAGLM